MSNIVLPHTWAPLEIPTAANWNANEQEIQSKFNTYAVQTDVAKVITVSHTQAADLLFSDALYDIGKSGATRPRHIYVASNVTVGDQLFMGHGMNTSSQAGDIILKNARNLRGVSSDGLDTRKLIQLNADDRIEVGQDFHSVYLPTVNGGTLLLGTTVTASSSAGDIILKNSRAVRGVNAAGNDTHALVHLDANDHLCLGGNTPTVNSGRHIRIKQMTSGTIPAGGAAADGLILIDSSNGDLVFYKGGSRYKVSGAAF